MELSELQNIWEQYDRKISENIQLNKEIAKKITVAKIERRSRHIRMEAFLRLIIPLLLIPAVLLPVVQYQTTPGFYIGLALFIILFGLASIFRIKYFLMAEKISLSKTISTNRKEVMKLEKYQFKMLRIGLLFLFPAVISIFLLLNISVLSSGTMIPLSLMIIILSASYFYRMRYSYPERFLNLNKELEEIENLEN